MDFIIDEINIATTEVVYALQLVVQKSIKKRLAKYTVIEILSFLTSDNSEILGTKAKARLSAPLYNLPLSSHLELYNAVEKILTTALPFLSN